MFAPLTTFCAGLLSRHRRERAYPIRSTSHIILKKLFSLHVKHFLSMYLNKTAILTVTCPFPYLLFPLHLLGGMKHQFHDSSWLVEVFHQVSKGRSCFQVLTSGRIEIYLTLRHIKHSHQRKRKGEITATRSHLAPLDCRELVSLALDDAADPDRSPSRF